MTSPFKVIKDPNNNDFRVFVIKDRDTGQSVTLSEKDASAFEHFRCRKMGSLWEKRRKATEGAERAKHFANMLKRQRRVTVAEEDWVVQYKENGVPSSAWPASEPKDHRYGVAPSFSGWARPYCLATRSYRHNFGVGTYMSTWGVARYASIEAAIRGAIKNREDMISTYNRHEKLHAQHERNRAKMDKDRGKGR